MTTASLVQKLHAHVQADEKFSRFVKVQCSNHQKRELEDDGILEEHLKKAYAIRNSASSVVRLQVCGFGRQRLSEVARVGNDDVSRGK